MIVKVRQGKAETRKPQCSWFGEALGMLLCVLLLFLPFSLAAQVEETTTGQAPEQLQDLEQEPAEEEGGVGGRRGRRRGREGGSQAPDDVH